MVAPLRAIEYDNYLKQVINRNQDGKIFPVNGPGRAYEFESKVEHPFKQTPAGNIILLIVVLENQTK